MFKYISQLNLNLSFPRKLAILGSTGSIGQSCLQVIANHPEKFQIIGLGAGKNIKLLARQAQIFKPRYLAVLTPELKEKLIELLPAHYNPVVFCGEQGYVQLATVEETEMVVAAIVGAAGLRSTLAAARAGKHLLLANKESIVLAGKLLQEILAQTQNVLLPIDSEHNAIFQAMQGISSPLDVQKIILTASGGPFLHKTKAELAQISPKQALNHPRWKMGAKISIDSATLMNKGLELIEAHYLFGMEPKQIDVIIHPQSIIHSLLVFTDGSHLAQLGITDMQIPIAYCLSYPHRLELNHLPSLDLSQVRELSFFAPDQETFSCLKLAKEALQAGPWACVVLNAANEVAVNSFLQEKIKFLDIPKVIGGTLEKDFFVQLTSLEDILELDQRAREKALVLIEEGLR